MVGTFSVKREPEVRVATYVTPTRTEVIGFIAFNSKISSFFLIFMNNIISWVCSRLIGSSVLNLLVHFLEGSKKKKNKKAGG